MGYTTNFDGEFKLDKPLSLGHTMILKALSKGELNDDEIATLPAMPDGYFQWEPTKDRRGIKWDGGEKFRDYTEWATWLCGLLKEWGYAMTGEVVYQGEEHSDRGVVRIVRGRAEQIVCPEREWKSLPRVHRQQAIQEIRACAEKIAVGNGIRTALDSAIRLLGEAVDR